MRYIFNKNFVFVIFLIIIFGYFINPISVYNNDVSVSFDVKSSIPGISVCQIYYANENLDFNEQKSHTSNIDIKDDKNYNNININFKMNHVSLYSPIVFRIDIGSSNSNISIKNIKINDYNIKLNNNNIICSQYIKLISLENDAATFYVNGIDPYFVINQHLSFNNNLKININYINALLLIFSIIILVISYKKEIAFLKLFLLYILFSIIIYIVNEKTIYEDYNYNFLDAMYKLFYENFLYIFIPIAIIIISFFLKNKILKSILYLTSFILFFIQLIDLFLKYELHARLQIAEVKTFCGDIFSGIPLAVDFFNGENGYIGFFICLFILVFASIVNINIKFSKKYLIYIVFILIIAISCQFLPKPKSTIFDYYYAPLLSINNSTENKLYSDVYKYVNYKANNFSINGLGLRKNVILLVIESLSSYESKFFGGYLDNLKNIDKLAQDNISFVNYFSNGYNTDTGIFAILTGKPYIHSNKHYTDQSYYKDGLVETLNKNGYNTISMYSAEDIGGIKYIYKNSSFKKIINGQDIFYRNSRRLVFNSVPDKDLLDNVLNHIPEWSKHEPYFTMITTISTHKPYQDPISGEYSFDKCITYIDTCVKEFVEKLTKFDFFKNGILIITGDHRAMTPVSLFEREKFGEGAIARVPMIIIDGKSKHEVYKNRLSHSSLSKIIEYVVLDKITLSDYQKIPFCNDINFNNDECIIYQKFGPRDQVMLYNKSDSCIKLDGDNTKIIYGQAPNNILNLIYYLRN